MAQAVSAGPSARRLGLADSADHVGFVVDKVALGHGRVSLCVLSVFALLLPPYQCSVLTFFASTNETIKFWQVTSLNKIQKTKSSSLVRCIKKLCTTFVCYIKK
jgi:hypothetical protein